MRIDSTSHVERKQATSSTATAPTTARSFVDVYGNFPEKGSGPKTGSLMGPVGGSGSTSGPPTGRSSGSLNQSFSSGATFGASSDQAPGAGGSPGPSRNNYHVPFHKGL